MLKKGKLKNFKEFTLIIDTQNNLIIGISKY